MDKVIQRAGLTLVLTLCLAGSRPASAGQRGSGEEGKNACGSGRPSAPDPAYRLFQDAAGRISGENPGQALGVQFDAWGVRVFPASRSGESWQWGLSVARRESWPEPAGTGGPWPLAVANRVDYRREGLSEWFVSTARGLRHGIDLEFEEGNQVRLVFALEGSLFPKVAADGRSVTFTDAAGRPVLAYRDLKGTDGLGRAVGVRWERIEGGKAAALRLALESAEHAPPIRIRGRLTRVKGAPRRTEEAGGLAASSASPEAVPGNDLCEGAEVLPGGGPFPVLSSVVDITDATTTGDPPVPSCQSDVSRSVWFSFTPDETGLYTFSLCSDAPTQTTLDDTVLAVYASTGACAGLTEATGGCDDDSCSLGDLQSVVSSLPLSAGTTYYAVVWKYSSAAPGPSQASVQLRVNLEAALPPPPANDQCPGAEVIPPAGPFPYTSSLVADISGATTTGDPPTPSCQPAVSRSVWYTFTPAATGSYTFSLCADAPTGTTVDDTVLALYSGDAACSGLAEVPGGCDDDSCQVEGYQSVISGATLTAGTTYYIVAWQFDTPLPAPGNTAVQLRVTQAVGPGNDTCAGAIPLSLDLPVSGTTAGAQDDTELSGSACFTGLGQTATTAAGGDVAYRFTAPSDGIYSFRVNGYDTTRNAVLYVASDCPASASPALITGCLGAANRNLNFPAEEVKCLPLSAGEQVYVYVDEASLTAGSPFTLEVNRCEAETEPNSTPMDAGLPLCGLEGSISPLSDVDFLSLGAPASGSRVFALVDGVASGNTGFDLRLTTSSDTLEFDDADNDVPFGTLSPNLAGTPTAGGATYLRVSHSSATQLVEPYRLYASVQPPAATATPESESNNSTGSADTGPNLYFSGSLNNNNDVDHFSFTAWAGELIGIGLDLDPTRDNTPFDGTLSLLDSGGAVLLTVNDGGATSSTASGAGSLSATTPRSPGESLVYRIRSTGTYYARVSTSSGTRGDYLLSISRNCRVSPGVDLAISQTDSPDPAPPDSSVTYNLTVDNPAGPDAAGVIVQDDLPAGAVLVSATPSQGSCGGSGPVVCQLGSLPAGGSATVSVLVTSPATSGPITNLARVTSFSVDPVSGNDASSETTSVQEPDSDGDGVTDLLDCAPADPDAWSVPGEATGLIFPSLDDATLMQWVAPTAPGGSLVMYDLVRSTAPDFAGAACVAQDLTGTVATDATLPAGLLCYLVRAENVCGGNLGADSAGTPRSAPLCP